MQGLYVIVSASGKLYVGHSIDIKERWRGHISELKRRVHHNIYLQNSWNKYGPEEFEFKVLYEMPGATRDELVNAEKDAIRLLCPEYNINLDPTVPNSLVESARIKLSNHVKKFWDDPQRRSRMIEAQKLSMTPERRAKYSKMLKNRIFSPEHRAKISAAQRGQKRQPLSLETRAKLSAALKGRIPWNKGLKS